MKEGEGGGEGRKETLADKPLDFENLCSPANAAPDWLGYSNNIDTTGHVGGFQNRGVCLQAFPSFLPPSPLFYLRHFSRGLWLSSFFAPKPHRNACFAG